MSADLDKVKALLRSVLQSSTRPIPLSNLECEYKLVTNEAIPYRHLGFANFQDFLTSIPDTVNIQRYGQGGGPTVTAVLTDSTEHLANLVRGQKKTTKGYSKPRRHFSQYRCVMGRGGPRVSLARSHPPSLPSLNHSNASFNSQTRSKYQKAETYVVPPRMQMRANQNLRVSIDSSNNNNNEQTTVRTVTRHPPDPVPVRATHQQLRRPIQPNWPPHQPRAIINTTAKPRPDSPPATGRVTTSSSTSSSTAGAAQLRLKPSDTSLPPPAAPPAATSSSHKVQLAKFAAQHSLGPISYRTTPVKLKSDRPSYISRVLVSGKGSFNSYPTLSASPMEAEDEAARCALEDLHSQLDKGGQGDLRVSPGSCVARRVYELLYKEHSVTGYFSNRVGQLYQDRYAELLPDDWMTYVEGSDTFEVNRVAANRAIIKPIKPECGSSTPESGSTPGSRGSTPSAGTPPPPPQQQEVPEVEPVPLVLPASNNWDVYVTTCTANAVWLRLIDYADEYAEMATDLDLHYLDVAGEVDAGRLTGPVAAGELLAAKDEDEGWHRVLVLDVLEQGSRLTVQFVDHGDVEVRSCEQVRHLPVKFRQLPFQAVQCRLLGLEQCQGVEMQTNVTNLTVGKALVAEVVTRDDCIEIILWDTSTETDVNINQRLLELALTVCGPPQLSSVSDAQVSYVSALGDIFVLLDGPHYTDMLENLAEIVLCSQPVIQPLPDTLYLAVDETEATRRCVLVDTSGASQQPEAGRVRVQMVDYGNEETVSTSCLFQLESHLLKLLMPRALRCRLLGVPATPDLQWTQRTTDHLLQLIADVPTVTVRAVGQHTTPVPIEAFIRDPNTNLLVSVGSRLSERPDLFDKRPSNTATGSSSRAIAPEITSVRLPPLAAMVDIHVTLAASPFNFVFQLLTELPDFDELQTRMQDFYEQSGDDQSLTLTPAELQPNGCYAARYKSTWYRVLMNRHESHGLVSIYFMDYGDFTVTQLDCVRRLHDSFRRVPAQALRGQLAGVEPRYGDWQIEDSLRFKELVDERDLVAFVVSYRLAEDAACRGHIPVVVVRLVDTTDPVEDVYIDRVFVEEKRALSTEDKV